MKDKLYTFSTMSTRAAKKAIEELFVQNIPFAYQLKRISPKKGAPYPCFEIKIRLENEQKAFKVVNHLNNVTGGYYFSYSHRR